ncbi:MAG: winged helix-turn-helix domain-containing protein [Anaerolineales bacterium]|nr:winged helix-turn-helix domain-containing protein [Anaerolineales bacterium]
MIQFNAAEVNQKRTKSILRSMATSWDHYPTDYRKREVQAILAAVSAGECVSVVGLSGSGKSNLLGYVAHRCDGQAALPRLVLIDCNRLAEFSGQAFFGLARRELGCPYEGADEVAALQMAIGQCLEKSPGLCLLLDRFDLLTRQADGAIYSNLRALRDTFKYTLTYVIATRHPLDSYSEFAELFYANTIWLGPLSASDARWNVLRYAQRKNLSWDEGAVQAIINFSAGYPSFLRAVCEAYAAGASLTLQVLSSHPAVRRRLEEFWADQPTEDDLRLSGLSEHPLLLSGRTPLALDLSTLTAKEHLLWNYLLAHPGQVCEKDDLVHAVWSEDKIYTQGIRDDSLAQLVRRLREKVEGDPSHPRYIQTVAGRGYRFMPDS